MVLLCRLRLTALLQLLWRMDGVASPRAFWNGLLPFEIALLPSLLSFTILETLLTLIERLRLLRVLCSSTLPACPSIVPGSYRRLSALSLLLGSRVRAGDTMPCR